LVSEDFWVVGECGLTWRRRLKGRQEVKVSFFIIDLRKVGQLG